MMPGPAELLLLVSMCGCPTAVVVALVAAVALVVRSSRRGPTDPGGPPTG